jgi:hypothetical protein
VKAALETDDRHELLKTIFIAAWVALARKSPARARI